MGIFGKKPGQEEQLAQKIGGYAVESALLIYNEPRLIDQEKVSEEKLTIAMFEFTFLYIHMASRIILTKLGLEKTNEIIPNILNSVKERYMEEVFKEVDSKRKELLEAVYHSIYCEAEEQYSKCTKLAKDNVSAASRMMGKESTSILTCFEDRLSRAYYNKEVSLDILFSMYIETLITSILAEKELEYIIDQIK